MEYLVRFTRRASKEMHCIAEWYHDQNTGLGEMWLRGIQHAIGQLSKNPDRFGLAHEADSFSYELRELYYGLGRRKTHRVLFRIGTHEVVVFGIRHFSQQDATPDNL